MEEINKMRIDGTYDNITKKERLMLDREYEKLEKVMGCISNLGRTPGAIFVVDIVKESIAINEAMKLNIPIFAIVDTNCDPDIPDYIIPANDDAAKAIQLITANVADAVIEGAAEREVFEEEQAVMEAMEKKSAEHSGDEEEGSDGPKRRRRRGAGGGAPAGGRGPRKG
jgi:small subunit ribosomal protein S2